MLELLNEIHNLEQGHKKQINKETYRSLILKREQLKDWMEKEDRKEINRVAIERFKLGNKVGKYLANILRKKKTLNYIEKIKNERRNKELNYGNSTSLCTIL